MHDRPNKSNRPSWWLLALVAGGIGVFVFCTSLVLRSDLVLRSHIDRELGRVGELLQGELQVERIRPAGLLDLRLQNFTFTPATHSEGARALPMVRVDELRLRPRLGDLLRFRPSVAQVILQGVTLNAVVGDSQAPHNDWFRWLLEDAPSISMAAQTGDTSRRRREHPERILLQDAIVTIDDLGGAFPGFGATLQGLEFHFARPSREITLQGRLHIEGAGDARIQGAFSPEKKSLEITAPETGETLWLDTFGGERTRDLGITAAGIGVSWPPQLELRELRVEGLPDLSPGAHPALGDELQAARVQISVDKEGLELRAVDVTIAPPSSDMPPLALASLGFSRNWEGHQQDLRMGFQGPGNSELHVDLSDRRRLRGSLRANMLNLAPLQSLLVLDGRLGVRGGVFSGSLGLVLDQDGGSLEIELNGNIQNLAVQAPAFGLQAIGSFTLDVEGHGLVATDGGAFVLDHLRLHLPETATMLTLRGLRDETHWTLGATLLQPDVSAQTLLHTIPDTWMGALAGLELEGMLRGRGSLQLDSRDLESLSLEIDIDTRELSVARFGDRAPIGRLSDADFVWAEGVGQIQPLGPGTDHWVALEELSPLTWRAVIAAEDDRFWIHRGFDPAGLRAALRANLEAGELVRGGSTISQQVIKNLFLTGERTFSRKLQEAILTWALEETLSKEWILTWYLNLAEWGPGVRGIGAAAQTWFAHSASQLTLREAAFLAAILPNPQLFGAQYARGELDESRRIKIRNILINLHRAGFLSQETLDYHASLAMQGVISASPPPNPLEPRPVAQVGPEDERSSD